MLKSPFKIFYKLRQFINAASTNDFANGRDAVIVFAAGKTGNAVLSASTRMLLNLRIPNSLPSFVKTNLLVKILDRDLLL